MPRLTQEQIDTFFEQGYLRIEAALRPEDLDPVQQELEGIVDREAKRLVAEGQLDSDYAELPFDKRLVPIAKADPTCPDKVRVPSNVGEALFNFLHNDRLLDLVESLIGPEIYCNSTLHVRPKMPATGDYEGPLSRHEWTQWSPFHQDAGVLLPEADDTLVVTTWIPLVDTDEMMGALSVYPRLHTGPLLTHEHPTDGPGNWKIVDEELPPGGPTTVPVKRGGFLIFHPRTPHGSGPNKSDRIRWSMDLRWSDARKANGRPYRPGLLVRSQENPELIPTREEWIAAHKVAQVSSRGVRAYRWPDAVRAREVENPDDLVLVVAPRG